MQNRLSGIPDRRLFHYADYSNVIPWSLSSSASLTSIFVIIAVVLPAAAAALRPL
jgi:hypothetical protein